VLFYFNHSFLIFLLYKYVCTGSHHVALRAHTWSKTTGKSWFHAEPSHRADWTGTQVTQQQPSQCVLLSTLATDQSEHSLLCRHWSAPVTQTNHKPRSIHSEQCQSRQIWAADCTWRPLNAGTKQTDRSRLYLKAIYHMQVQSRQTGAADCTRMLLNADTK